MNLKALEFMKKTLKPISKERLEEIIRQRTTPGSYEQLTLEDAGLEDEVRELRSRRTERTQGTR